MIGGGPAGLAAGMHLSRAGYRTLLLEKDEPGGQARRIERIENYPGFPAGIRGEELMALWLAQARRWKLAVRRAQAKEIIRQNGRFEVILADGPALWCRAVVCCIGAEFKRLDVPGEGEFRGRGVHHAAFEDAPLFRNKAVAVVGSGEAAVHQALLLSRFARRVYLLSRGMELKAHRLLRKRLASRPNLVHVPNKVVESMRGRRRLESILVRDTRRGLRGRLNVAGLFVLIGKRKPNLRPNGREGPGYFIAGDATGTPCRQVAAAGGRGVEAAMACIRYLEGWNDPNENS